MTFFAIGKNSTIGKRFAQDVQHKKITWISSNPGEGDLALNLLEPDWFDYNVIHPDDYIVLLAAISSPDVCKNNFEMAYQINVTGTSQFIKSCLERGAKVLFMSSDTVYGDCSTIANEKSLCNPIGEYGKMKYEIEQKFADRFNFKTFRLSYVFARTDKFTSYLSQCALKSSVAEIFHPFYRNIVYIKDLIDAMLTLETDWDRFNPNVVNLCGPEPISRVDLAELYKKNIDDRLNSVQKYPGDDFFKARPQTIEVESLYLQDLLGRSPIDIETAMIQEFQQID